MPELPEVESFRRFIERHTLGKQITSARALDEWMLSDATPRRFARQVRGRRIVATFRRGKQLILYLNAHPNEADPPAIALHFGMSGRPVADTGAAHVHDRMILRLDDGTSFRLRDPRRLGSVRLLSRSEAANLIWTLGPDALEAPLPWFRTTLATRSAAVKAVLLNQAVIAGVGNLYADEALFAAGIAPGRPACSLDAGEAGALLRALRTKLRRGVRDNIAAGLWAPMSLRLRRRPGAACGGCGTPIVMSRVGGRSTYWCPSCQR